MRNDSVLNSLPNGVNQTNVPAFLTDRDGRVLFSFLYNPYKIDYSRRATFAEVPVGGTSIQSQYYLRTEGKEAQFDDLLMDAYCETKDVTPLIKQLEDLLVTPQPVYFSWGNGIFGPAILKEANWTPDLFLSGVPARVRYSITLKEIPNLEETSPQAVLTEPVATSRRELTLTTRQREKGRTEAEKYLQSNLNLIIPSVSQVVRNRNYVIKVAKSGLITILNSKDTQIAEVGTYDGKTFTPSTGVQI